jgi:hypothetical protein
VIPEGVETTEVPWEEGARLINQCEYLFTTEIRETEGATLGLTIVEAKAQVPISTLEDSSPLATLKLGGRPIEQDDTCRVFQLRFDRNHMISYTVLNESYGKYPSRQRRSPASCFASSHIPIFWNSPNAQHTLPMITRAS